MKHAIRIILAGLLAFIALLGAAFAADDPFRQHMWIAFFVLAAFTVALMRNASFAPEAPVDEES